MPASETPRPRLFYPGGKAIVAVYSCVLVTCGLFVFIYWNHIWQAYKSQTPGHPPVYGDFFALWSYARLLGSFPASDLYNSALLHQRQIALGMDPKDLFPFPYPPTFILMLWPLDILPYDLSYLATMGLTLALFIWVLWRTCTRNWLLLLTCLAVPATVGGIFVGQAGFFYGALVTAGIRLAATRPIVAGALIGFAAYKPQLGILIPVALASARAWRTVASAAVTVVALAATATVAYGWRIWADWLAMLPDYADLFDRRASNLRAKPTIMANLQVLGLSLDAARVAQWLVTAAVAAAIWRVFRQGATPRAAAALCVGVFLATPHAFYYDLPLMLAGMVLFIDNRLAARGGFSALEIVVLVLATLFPVTMMLTTRPVAVSAICLALMFWIIVQDGGGRRDLRLSS